mmetsp:Transcript_6012/g.8755  ORF Transcript_6012/g.8755 Transcript_6012/m.8755 type:complete len:450 (+) Transcript_6012:65-1414(+)
MNTRIEKEPFITRATYIEKKTYRWEEEEEEEEGMPMIVECVPEEGEVGETIVAHIQLEGFPLQSKKIPIERWRVIIIDQEEKKIIKTIPIPVHHIYEGITAFQLGKFEKATTLTIRVENDQNKRATTNEHQFIIHNNNLFLEDDMMMDDSDDINMMTSMMKRTSSRKKLSRQTTLTKLNFEMDAHRFEENIEHSLDSLHTIAEKIDCYEEDTEKEKRRLYKEPLKPAKHALLLNISLYDHMEPLKTPEFDGTLMAARLQDQHYQIHALHNNQVNKSSIASVLNQLPPSTLDNDQLVIHFAGHGLPGRLCLSNYNPTDPSTYLTLHELLHYLPSTFRHVLILLDCCHAGTTASTYMLHAHTLPPPPTVLRHGNVHIVSSTMSHIALEDSYHGLFTAACCRALRQAVSNPQKTFADLFHHIATELVPFQQMPYLFQLCGVDPFYTQGFQER